MAQKARSAFLVLAILGLALRAGFVLAADNRQLTFHSGGSDAPIYEGVAQHLLDHEGFSYKGHPTAFHAPGYPFLLAGFMAVFGGHYIAAIRWLQLLVGVLTAGICALAALRLLNGSAAAATLVFGLFMPTLVFSTAQVLPECLSAFLAALFLFFLVRQYETADPFSAAGMGLSAGFGALVRFNMAALPFIAAWAVFRTRDKKSGLSRWALVLLVPLAVISPWLVRNLVTFHGRVLFSTETGEAAVMGVVMPQGRTQPGDTERLYAAMGWQPGTEPGTAASSEVQDNQRGLQVAPRLWKEEGWNAIPVLAKKAFIFWLGTDQLVDTQSFPLSERLIRGTSVLAYWVVLAFAVAGWFQVRRLRPAIASAFLLYAVVLTVLHLPLTMNTRLRIPLMDPLIVILSGAGWVQLGRMWSSARTSRAAASDEGVLSSRSISANQI